jgi:hypothetical protein
MYVLEKDNKHIKEKKMNADIRYRRKKRIQYNIPAIGRNAEHGRRDLKLKIL